MADQLPVFVEVKRDNGSTERVRVGSATRDLEGFVLRLGEFYVGSTPEPARRAAPAASSGGGGGGGEVFPNYGRSKGQPIRGATMGDLEFYANGSRRSLNDPGKARFHDKERVLLAAIEAEIARQKGEGGGDDGPPPPSDEDAPF
jgi:hypothetical protein